MTDLSKEDYEVELIIRSPCGKKVCKKTTVYSWNNIPHNIFLSEFQNTLKRLSHEAIEETLDGPQG